MPKRTRRSFAACWTCRRRRVACDGLDPCSPCQKRELTCEGYRIRLVWVDSEKGTYKSHSRRTLEPQLTWSGHFVYGEEDLNHLVDTSIQGCECKLHTCERNPFRLLQQRSPRREHLKPAEDLQILSLGPPVLHGPRLDWFLFHHYVNQVAFLMIPIDSASNPWRSTYPSLALPNSTAANKSLYHALLSQAAFNLSVLHVERPETSQSFRSQAFKHYGSSLSHLRASLDQPRADYSTCVASLLTLIMIEGAYATDLPQEWRTHFEGASAVVLQFLQEYPWLQSSDAWVITQSLALSLEVSQTGRSTPVGRSRLTKAVLDSVSSVGDFGYTIGACREIISSISSIRLIGEDMANNRIPEDMFGKVSELIQRLSSDEAIENGSIGAPANKDITALDTCRARLSGLHRQMFRNAVLIYLYRTVYDASPSDISTYVTFVLSGAVDFLDCNGGSISIWPVFIAAVEACTEQQRAMARRWLEYSCTLGIANRYTAKRIIEQVWDQRDARATLCGMPPSEIVVDWKEVQQGLEVDILLL